MDKRVNTYCDNLPETTRSAQPTKLMFIEDGLMTWTVNILTLLEVADYERKSAVMVIMVFYFVRTATAAMHNV